MKKFVKNGLKTNIQAILEKIYYTGEFYEQKFIIR